MRNELLIKKEEKKGKKERRKNLLSTRQTAHLKDVAGK